MSRATTPDVATPPLMARTLATFYLFGGLSGCLAALGAEGPTSGRLPLVALGLLALVSAGALSRWGSRMRRALFHVPVAAATALITVAILVSPDPATALVVASIITFIAVDAFFFFPAGPGGVQFVAAVGSVTWALCVRDDVSVAQALALDGVVTAIALVTWSLAQRASGASRDALTGLRNRRGFDEALQERITEADRTGAPLSAALLDLDHFKSVNDTSGHEAGDRALCRVAGLWSRSLPDQAVLARHGGDEFSLLMPGLSGTAALEVVRRLSAEHPDIRVSCGVAEYRRRETAAQLMRRADGALYDAKTAGRGRCELHGGAHAALAHDLARALDAGDVVVHYQPVLDLETGWVTGVEALARWTHPIRGSVSPAEFIPVAEQHGLIGALGETVLRASGRDLAGVIDARGRQLRVGVNVSGAELADADYPRRFLALVTEGGLTTGDVVVEVTESLVEAQSSTALQVLQELRDAGVLVAMDDFGTGYSSLARLDTLPIDYIKLDHSFIATIGTSERRAQVLRSLVDLCGTLGLGVVAEGVETSQQEEVLRAAGCTRAQGWLYSAALPIDELLGVLHPEPADLAG